ncbi:unnamed protein product [Cylindrotheca closterium]|uniref:CCHC-type domain-containing protein n=1 Tax=Cylindrotheca closterium TaxID=2856 RepID=A0AAD2FI91_9STRA|nr:unnamed protein product [Cylindrotheca closterium]
MLNIHMDVIKIPGVNLYQAKDQPNKGKGKPKDDKKKAACYVCGKEDHMSPKCPDRLLPESQWKHPKRYVDYGKKLNLNQIGATVPATVPGPSPATSVITGGTLSVAGSVNTPLRPAGTTGNQMIQVPTGNQMMQVPSGMQLMQIPTQGGGTVTVPYSMNANGEIAFSGMQLSQQGFSGAQVRQRLDATQARTPQVVKTGYFDTSNVFHDAIKGKDENGNDVYLIPCPTRTTNVELQSDWHYASESEDLPDLATEADRGMQFIQSRRVERDPFGLLDHVIMDRGCTNTTICNGELMPGLRQAEKELDMHTNMGSRVSRKISASSLL